MKKRVVGLDLMKFLMSFIVVFHHFQQLTGAAFDRFNFYGGTITFSYMLEMFFMISGILAWGGRKGSEATFGHYMKRKIVRLFPMAAITAIVYSVIAWLYKAQLGVWFGDNNISLAKLLLSVFLVHDGGVIRLGVAANNVTWYFCVLLICYVIFWLIMWISRKLDVNPIWMLAFMSAVGLAILKWDYNAPFFNYSTGRGYAAFFLGVVIGRLIEIVKEKYMIMAAIAAVIFFAIFVVFDLAGIREELYISEVYFFYPALVLLFYYLPLPEMKLISDLGAISFETILWHLPTILLLIFLNDMGITSIAYSFTTMIVLVVVVDLWSAIMYFAVEGRLNNSFANFIEKIRK